MATTSAIKAFLEPQVKFFGEKATVPSYLIKHGKLFTPANAKPLKKALRDRMLSLFHRSQFTQKQACFSNSQQLAFFLSLSPVYDNKVEVLYWEGQAIHEGLIMPLLHGWNTVNGSLVDFTWAQALGDTRLAMGILPPGSEYLGVPITKDQFVEAQLVHKMYISLLEDWQCGFPLIFGGEHRKPAKKRVKRG